LSFDLSGLFKQSKNVKSDDFINTVEHATDLISYEDGQVGNFIITGRLVQIDPSSEVMILSDLHGDFDSLKKIFEKSNFITKMNNDSNAILVFLGDYGDRGEKQISLYHTVLNLKIAFPEQVVLIRGNHEGPLDLMPSPHDLPNQLQRKFKEKGTYAYAKLRKLFDCLYNAAYVEDRYLMVHAGFPLATRNLQDIAQAEKLHPDKPFLKEILWNDPSDTIITTAPSPRGAGCLFGEKITTDVLNMINAKILIRGHEFAPNGYKISHNGKILTLFSRKGAPYNNPYGAYLQFYLEEKIEKADQLLSFIHRF